MASDGGFLMDGATIIGVDKNAKELKIPGKALKVGQGAFDGCKAEYLDVSGAMPEVFEYVKLHIPESVRTLRNRREIVYLN